MSKGKRKQTHHHVRNVSIADDFPSHNTKVYMSTLKAGEADLDNLGDFEFLGRLSKDEVDFICEHNPTNIPYETLDFSVLNDDSQSGKYESKQYFEEAQYINSSPLTHDEKLSLSTQEVGVTKLIPGGLLSFMEAEQEMKIEGEVFEFSGLDLIAAEIDHKTLKFKR